MKWSVVVQADSLPHNLRETPFLIVDYRAVGVTALRDYFIYTTPSKPTLPQQSYLAAWLDKLIPDGKRHQLVARLPEPVLDELAMIAVQVQAETPDAEVVIRSVKLASLLPEPTQSLEDLLPTVKTPLLTYAKALPLDLMGRCNLTLGQLAPDLPVRDFLF